MKRVVGAMCAVLVLAGCTGVPSSSAPEAVEALNRVPVEPPPPDLNSDARTIVTRFLKFNASNTGSHVTARAYLAPAANNRWSDRSATIIASDYSVGLYNSSKHTVTVYGRVLGTLDDQGIYTPNLQGRGGGGERQPFVFKLACTDRCRITGLQPGLLINEEQFRDTYRQHLVYFYDIDGSALVPDVRWSAIADPTQLAEWLLTQIVNGPRPELRNAVSADTLPARADAAHITVTPAVTTRIEIPGSRQLDPAVRYRLAAQLSQTLADVITSSEITITDDGRPISIPTLTSTAFSPSEFYDAIGPPAIDSAVYYLDGGRIRNETGRLVPGMSPYGGAYLASFAIGRRLSGSPLTVAAVGGTGNSARLYMGTQEGGIRPTTLVGPLTRPSFAPGRDEAWIGSGPKVYRATLNSGTVHIADVPLPAVSGGGQVLALRLSPEGGRIAIVVSGARGSAQLYVGAIVRGAGRVRIDGLEPISPDGVAVKDVAWLDSSKLFAIGHLVGSKEAKTFETGVDGTEWTNAGTGNLPNAPDSVTATSGSSVWVSADNYVWRQSGSDWVSPGPTGQTPGNAPVYLE
jgi:Lipoprotein LpqB beta-propeller domain